MKKQSFIVSLFFVLSFITANSQSKIIDTLVDVGKHRIHFKIVKGKGTPILFDAGGGNDGSVWNSILKPLPK